MVPGENTERLAKLLRDCGAGVELQWSPGGHGLTADDIRAAKAWLG
jgi:predicted esterase